MAHSTAAMEDTRRQLMEHTLATNGSFLLCDPNAIGFPIRYANETFLDLYQCDSASCVGKKFDAVIGASSIKSCTTLSSFASALGHAGHGEIDVAIALLSCQAAQANKAMAREPDRQTSFILAPGRKMDNTLFVCENVMLTLKHPTVGWSYAVCMQRESKDVSIEQLFDAAFSGTYGALVKKQEAALKTLVSTYSTGGGATAHFHEKAAEMWKDIMLRTQTTKLLAPGKALKNARSLASASTGTGGSSKTFSSSASSDVFYDSDLPAETGRSTTPPKPPPPAASQTRMCTRSMFWSSLEAPQPQSVESMPAKVRIDSNPMQPCCVKLSELPWHSESSAFSDGFEFLMSSGAGA